MGVFDIFGPRALKVQGPSPRARLRKAPLPALVKMVKVAGFLIAFFSIVGFLTMSAARTEAPRARVQTPVIVCTKELKAGSKIDANSFVQVLQEDVPFNAATEPVQVTGLYINCNRRVGDRIHLQDLLHDRSNIILSAYRTKRKIENGEALNLSNVALDRAAIGELPPAYISNCSQFNAKSAARDLDAYSFFAAGDMK